LLAVAVVVTLLLIRENFRSKNRKLEARVKGLEAEIRVLTSRSEKLSQICAAVDFFRLPQGVTLDRRSVADKAANFEDLWEKIVAIIDNKD